MRAKAKGWKELKSDKGISSVCFQSAILDQYSHVMLKLETQLDKDLISKNWLTLSVSIVSRKSTKSQTILPLKLHHVSGTMRSKESVHSA